MSRLWETERMIGKRVVLALALSTCLDAGAATLQPRDVSFANEVKHAIDKGLEWLTANQKTNGCWSTADDPAVTALALEAFMGEPTGRFQKHPTPAVRNGYNFILSNVKPDGGIYAKELQNYNTAICMMALVTAKDPKFDGTLRHARQWLLGQQIDLNEKGKIDSPFDGGVGYGDKHDHSDMNNTLTALEALYYTKYLDRDKPPAANDLNWPAVIHFIQSCQNLPAYNKESWASDDAKNKGGFVYTPGESKAGSETNSSGRIALRSYGSISYAGLLSYVYADLKQDDPRVVAVMDWLKNNWTVNENPGMGEQGLYYYLHLMTKGLSISDVNELTLSDGKTVNWRKAAATKLLDLQKADGSWQNSAGRWWEKEPVLVTAYAVITLEMIYRGL
jgi:squalene-hopene/tetraprenyl-beta-curcumene cyclase